MATIQGVDSSYDSLTVDEARCLKEKGIRLFVQALTALPRTGLHQPNARITNLRRAYSGGLQTAAYLLIGPGMTGRQAVAEARRNVPMDVWEQLKFVAVDVEVDGIAVYEVLAALQEVERLGKTAIIYTSWNTWNNMIRPRNSTLIANRGYGVWNASWDNNPDIDYRYLPFGGWKPEDVIGEQWSGGTIVCDQSVDQNTFQEYVLLPIEEDETKPVITSQFPDVLPVVPMPGSTLMKSNLQLAVVYDALMDKPAWWLASYPLAWKMHITNLAYMDYMQKKNEWPKGIWRLNHNQRAVFQGILYLGQIPRPIT